MTVGRYAQRFARIPRALDVLANHPDGLPLATLARELDVPEDVLREELLAFFVADVVSQTVLLDHRNVALSFLGSDGSDADVAAAEIVRLDSEEPLADLGLEYFTATTLGPLHRAAAELLALEPANADLAAAVETLERTVLAGMEAGTPYGSMTAADLRDAARRRQRVALEYERFWVPGIVRRVVDPYRVVSTRRGFELDAGPLDEEGSPRTYLVSLIRGYEVLDDDFDLPEDVDARIAEHRRETEVHLVVPHDRRWAVDMLAERVTVVDSDRDDLELRARLLPPVRDRVGLLQLLAGPDAIWLEPADLTDAGPDLAEALLTHHGLA
ncbi:MAG: WYL domain-containing protein [Candidatus Nanopelagicales bacterium]